MAVVEHAEVRPQVDTWPKLLRQNAERYGTRGQAMRYKHYGIWQAHNWADYLATVRHLSLGLLSLGFKRDSRLLIVGENAPEWYFAQLAAQCAGGVGVGLYSELSAEEIEYIAKDCGAEFAMVEDQEQADKITAIRERLPRLKTVVYWRYKGLSEAEDGSLVGLRHVLELGRRYEQEHPGAFEENIAAGKADDICSVVYTSGTTGRPKGATHSYASLMAGARCQCELDRLTAKDNLASYLPPAWITEQVVVFGCHLLCGGTVVFTESAQTHRDDIREIAPTLVLYSSRLWESLAGEVQARMQGASFLKRVVTRLLMPVGYRVVDAAYAGRTAGLQWQALRGLAALLVFRPVRDRLGLPRARVCYSTGSTLAPQVVRFFNALGVSLRSLYASAEAGIVAGATAELQPLGSNGRLNPGVELNLSPQGELLVRHAGTFLGYLGRPAGAGGDGWVVTGDTGRLTPGRHLVFVDRLADMAMLASGDLVAPQDVESRLKSSPYIRDAWVLAGEEFPGMSAVVIVDAANTGRWADKAKVTYTTFRDLSQKAEVYRLIEREIVAINQELPEAQQVERFVNLHKEFDPDELELTHNRKLRRHVLRDRYGTLVDALARGVPDVEVDAQFTYQDGRTGSIRTALHIATVGQGDR